MAAVAAQADVTKLGPAVGAAAPAFSLVDQHGRTQSLGTIAGTQGTMLVFFRSADW
jgi:peroxiredoxin